MKTPLFLILFLIAFSGLAQTVVTGTVKDAQNEPLPGVNIYIEGTYDGGSSNENGEFHFTTSAKGLQKLKASFIGFKTWESEINLSKPVAIDMILKESVNTIDAVTITAGVFAASDEKRASILQPLDIYTTAGTNADIMAAMKTMPGTQASPDDGRLMVRGGDAYESKTYIDGLIAAQPYYSKTPDVATRGRFSPSLFSGVQFNSGGYSAEYGQALSSVLNLNSTDVAT
ncbi:MAG TPA: TonB-dependent receptor, partial [Prolixibacteraceae bacterium]|nr:TonB-dependent receptor [Prolixibacteraceae bacterium]